MLLGISIFWLHVQNTFFQGKLVILEMDTGFWSMVKFLSTEGGSVNKENLQQMFPVVAVVWISMTVFTCLKYNPKWWLFWCKTKPHILKLNSVKLTDPPCPLSIFKITSTRWKKAFWMWREKMLFSSNIHGDIWKSKLYQCVVMVELESKRSAIGWVFGLQTAYE